MVTKGEKRKKTKIKAYDIDESKKIFLYAYEHQLKNEKIDWKKAEEMKITKHSGGSMRSHYLNSIKNDISLYLEMYPEEAAKIFNKVKRLKREEKKKKILVFQNNFVKQSSNISLNRLTKGKNSNYNKHNSLIISNMFSIKHRNINGKHKTFYNNDDNNEKKKKKNLNNNTTNELNSNKSSSKKNKLKQIKITNKDTITKNKKINKKKNNKSLKSIIIRSTLERTNKMVNNPLNKEMNNRKNKNVNEKKYKYKQNTKEKTVKMCENYEKKLNEKTSKAIIEDFNEKKKNRKLVKEDAIQIKLEKVDSNDQINKELNELKILNKNLIEKNKNLSKVDDNLEKLNLESRSTKKNNQKKISVQNKMKNKKYKTNDNTNEINDLNDSFDSSESSVSDNIEENKGNTIKSIFGYIYKKIFR
ncbi:conserved Plasmodium protein, unknown function [Plasmodium relictum]|uniref:Uncharacterized protein n=1 Tax=Plasmodium relictum TaxID=85471 RepID=A0A1J1HDY2_PLARL|nr:conserved Plasmodium protein, unknown function [Plasmodium relictum]CRH04007.1 conserved Plasmodium protein, unknown function [Plasmodium relictum]